MNMLYELLTILCFSGIIILIGTGIIKFVYYLKDREFYNQWKQYADKCELIHFPDFKYTGSFKDKHLFKYCSNIKKGWFND